MTLTKAYLFLCRHPSPYERQLPAPPDGAVVAAAAPAGAGGGHRRPSWSQSADRAHVGSGPEPDRSAGCAANVAGGRHSLHRGLPVSCPYEVTDLEYVLRSLWTGPRGVLISKVAASNEKANNRLTLMYLVSTPQSTTLF